MDKWTAFASSKRQWFVVAVLVAVTGGTTQNAPATSAAPQRAGGAPPTVDGRPDLQGAWNFSSLTPLERPKEFADKAFVTGDDAIALQRLMQKYADAAAQGEQSKTAYHPDTWYEDGTHGARRGDKVASLPTSLII